jgi:DNA invertase Pin-like site-specific DNA recombinase
VQTLIERLLAIYSRTSTDFQDKGLEAQNRALEDYCKAKGLSNYLKFSDNAISGMKASRPEFNRMMAAARAGEIHTILVYSFSRFARSTRHLLESLEEFQRLGIAFVSLTEQVDTNTPIGRAFFTIIAAIAQLERDLTAERVRNGLRNARAKGKILGTPKRVPDEKIRELRELGLEIKAITLKLGVSRASVYRALSHKPS